MSDEEPLDPMPAIREGCMAKTCKAEDKLYKDCVKRITDSKQGDCEAWYIDYVQCIDKCVAPKIFNATKGG